MTSFTQFLNQDLEQGKVNGGCKIIGKKGLKNASSNVYSRLEFGKISRKDLVRKKM